MRQSEIIKYYSRKDIQEELVRVAEQREVAIKFQGGVFGKRPEVLSFPKEVEQFARQGATSFHISQERWSDPLKLSPIITKKEMNDLRKGWDFVIDIDCPWFEYSTYAAEIVLEALKFHNTKAAIKFSGNRGWHIAIPFEAFPSKVGTKQINKLFPEASTAIISYLREFIEERLLEKIKEKEGDIKTILSRTNRKKEEFLKEGKLNITALVDLDLSLGAQRHLIRAPYSIHETTGLISLPIKVEDITNFKKEWAKPENVREINDSFFNGKYVTAGSARQLLIQALDWKEIEEQEETKDFIEIKGKQSEDKFPPCIRNILKGGLEDYRKRGLFILLNFLKCVNWDWKDVENKIYTWNSTNNPPLKLGYIRSQLNWHKRRRNCVPPANCKSVLYYKETRFCKPNTICQNIKNPVSYVKRKQF